MCVCLSLSLAHAQEVIYTYNKSLVRRMKKMGVRVSSNPPSSIIVIIKLSTKKMKKKNKMKKQTSYFLVV